MTAQGGGAARLDAKTAEELERRYDAELRFRQLSGFAAVLVPAMLVALSVFHYYTAGFGILPEHWHKAIHLSAVLGLIFLMFPAGPRIPGPEIGGVPWYDWTLAALMVAACLYLPLVFDELTFRIGSPNTNDVVMGTIMLVLTLETCRRSMGWALPIVVLVCIAYGLWGNHLSGVLAHPGADWEGFISHIYLTQEGIFGIPVMVVSTYVFHFVLFGVLATRMGLGQFFIDMASIAAGRFAGGPAKVSVFGSALFGMISGSAIANTVTVGTLTIPAMKRVGYKPQFAAAVEAAASAGGQITPPIMGAAAFVMIEFLNIPLTTLLIAAAVPAFMHFWGVFVQVHFEAKKHGLAGLPEEEIPRFGPTLRAGWPTMIPLVLLLGAIVNGNTPYLAAFYGITACIVVGFLNPRHRMSLRDLWDAFDVGARYAIAVGAAAAAVGVVVGVITLTGAGFRVSFVVTTAAAETAALFRPLLAVLPSSVADLQSLTLFMTLFFIALVCVVMGTGLPTTALYIVLAAIAAPALTQLGVQPLAAHLFILYYGVLADLTPPVCIAAYAAAGIAGADPFKTGNSAFRLGMAKATVPFVFAYSPSMLIMVEGFTWSAFFFTTLSCALGVLVLGIGMTGFAFARIGRLAQGVLVLGALLMISPNLILTATGLAIAAPILLANWFAARRSPLPQ